MNAPHALVSTSAVRVAWSAAAEVAEVEAALPLKARCSASMCAASPSSPAPTSAHAALNRFTMAHSKPSRARVRFFRILTCTETGSRLISSRAPCSRTLSSGCAFRSAAGATWTWSAGSKSMLKSMLGTATTALLKPWPEAPEALLPGSGGVAKNRLTPLPPRDIGSGGVVGGDSIMSEASRTKRVGLRPNAPPGPARLGITCVCIIFSKI
mmetsp:Transcript_28140/g.69293  ORF Transcript_28140/g.69293 Transcript_28140/m.69293 type:complete len:211 (-) Transcript_28140:222-854(-)